MSSLHVLFLYSGRIECFNPISPLFFYVHAVFFRKSQNCRHLIRPPLVCRARLAKLAVIDDFNLSRQRWTPSLEMNSISHNACMVIVLIFEFC